MAIGWPDVMIVHHSASTLDTTVDDIRAWHTDPRRKGGPFQDIGYHYVIHGDGGIFAGRPLPFIGAHAAPHNRRSIGVCLVGDNTRDGAHWTHDQIYALRWLYSECRRFWGGFELKGHRDVVPEHTICPGCDVHELVLGRERR